MAKSIWARLAFSVSGLAIVGSTSVASAQDAQTDPARTQASEEIVVTAERRESSVQRVPASIEAFSGETLSLAGIENTEDLAIATTGLQISRTGPNGFPFLRGIGTSVNPIGSDPSVAVYFNGIYRPRTRDSLVEFLDVGRVEVLKGPQGTLYGRNAVGGTINVWMAEPENEFSGAISAAAGNFDLRRGEAMLNLPLGDAFAVRFAARASDRSGFVENIAAGGPDELEDEQLLQGRVSARWTPTDSFELLGYVDYAERDSNGYAFRATTPGFPNFSRDVIGAFQPSDPRTVSNDYVNPVNALARIYGLDATWDISEDVSLNVRAARQNSAATESVDRDDTAVPFSFLSATDRSESDYIEAVLTYPLGDRLELTSGATWFDENVLQFNEIGSGLRFVPPPGFVPLLIFSDITYQNSGYGAFTQGTFSFTDATRITLGARYSSEDKSYTNASAVGVGGPPMPVPAFGDDESWSSTTWLARLEHDLGAAQMLYFSASTGFKSGGFNTAVPAPAPAFDPEEATAYEIGYKSRWFDDVLTFNAAIFYYDLTGIQVLKNTFPVNSIENASAGNVLGAEFELSYRPNDNWSFDLGVGLLDTEFTEYDTNDPYAPVPTLVDLSGSHFPRAPEVTVNFAAQYEQPIGQLGSLLARLDVSYRSDFYFRAFERDYDREDGYALVNGRLVWSLNDAVSIELFGQNLTDELYRVNLADPPAPASPGNYYGAPRTYGVQVGYRF